MPLLGPLLRRGRRTPRPRVRAAVAFAASLALNLLALLLLAASGAFELGRRAASAPVAVAPVNAREWNANRAVRPPAPEPHGKVVELPPEQPAADEAPADAKFLSDRNTRVERETVSRYAGRYPRLAPRPEPGAAPSPADPPAAAAASRGLRRQGRAAPGDARTRQGESLALLRPDPDGELPRRDGVGTDRAGAPPRASPGPTLSLDGEALARIAGGPSMDGFRDVEEGDETWLQSREFRFATFLNQMRREIGDEWHPRVREAIEERDPDGESFFYRERTVVLGISLAPSGDVKGLTVLESSSIPFLDEVAMTSVREAQPFPNPPRAMFDDGPEVRVPFAFTIYPSQGRGVLRWRAPGRP